MLPSFKGNLPLWATQTLTQSILLGFSDCPVMRWKTHVAPAYREFTAGNVAACAFYCKQEAECNLWTFVHSETLNCHLTSDTTTTESGPFSVSGPKSCWNEGLAITWHIGLLVPWFSNQIDHLKIELLFFFIYLFISFSLIFLILGLSTTTIMVLLKKNTVIDKISKICVTPGQCKKRKKFWKIHL